MTMRYLLCVMCRAANVTSHAAVQLLIYFSLFIFVFEKLAHTLPKRLATFYWLSFFQQILW